MPVEPGSQLVARDVTRCDAFKESDCLVLLCRRVDPPRAAVPRDEFEQGEVAHPLVPVRQRVISDHVPGENCRLLRELGICLDAFELGCRRGESGLRERNQSVDANQLLRWDVEEALRDCEEVGEVEILDLVRYRASLSRIAWFSFMNRSSRSWKS
jgi:hypothetical protein